MLTRSNENVLGVYERKLLRRMYRPVNGEVFEEKNNEGLYTLLQENMKMGRLTPCEESLLV